MTTTTFQKSLSGRISASIVTTVSLIEQNIQCLAYFLVSDFAEAIMRDEEPNLPS